MVRFSCFLAHVHSNKPKKTVQPSIEVMAKTLQDGSQNQVSTNSSRPTSSNPLLLKAPEEKQMNNVKNHGSNLASVECGRQSEDLKSMFVIECNREVCHTGCLKRSQSLESGLCQEGGLHTDNLTEGDTDPGLSYNGFKSDNESTISGCRKDQEANPTNQCKKNPNSEFQISSGLGGDYSMFSIGDPTPSDKDEHEISNTPAYVELSGDSTDHTPLPGTPILLVKSCSLPEISVCTLSSGKCSFKHESSKSRSSDDLCVLGMRQKEICTNESDDQIRGEHARENNMGNVDSLFSDVYDSYPLSGVAKDWIMPVVDDMDSVKILQGESHLDELPNKDFHIKRLEDWVIGLQHCGPLEGTSESPESIDPLNGDVNTMNGLTAARVHGKVTPGMEAAKRYIPCLSANATAAQLANHGLVVIPFLSAFVSLKVLNLSGNAIVRITTGALPRGLHILNLSKNNISTIEGLRELTRLRVLDLSYNRIFRIGHGLASCSSLKELYLAGNKISEIEGLHRLLKLSVLDLRCNKISTAKCLGQLAANYNSLKAISLEGNPAQKNVGDEQLKKHLQGLIPHLAYYNRQTIKASLKDAADRSVRLGINSHHIDRSLGSDHKITRKGSHGVAALRPSTSSTQARRSQTVDSPKGLKGRQGHLPPIGNKVSTQSRHHFDVGSKQLNFKSDLSIRRSRSEGTLGAC